MGKYKNINPNDNKQILRKFKFLLILNYIFHIAFEKLKLV